MISTKNNQKETEVIFSYAENAEGRMVHVDSVRRGLRCGCRCPRCHEQVIARHGQNKRHGFAHHSSERKANLDICYRVSLYKLAEQMIQTKKKIQAPSYYGIFKDDLIHFEDVKIDCNYEREDKQPDVIAITSNKQQYLIEFIFKDKVQHKKTIDYENMNCLEIDLSHQTFESLEDFLFSSSEDRRWINNSVLFNNIEQTYIKANKPVKVVSVFECQKCGRRNNYCTVMKNKTYPLQTLIIEHNGEQYRLCKSIDEHAKTENSSVEDGNSSFSYNNEIRNQKKPKAKNTCTDISCFNCESHLSWKKTKHGCAYCGCSSSLQLISPNINPEYAKKCKNFRMKEYEE